jgi:hypothetical protein
MRNMNNNSKSKPMGGGVGPNNNNYGQNAYAGQQNFVEDPIVNDDNCSLNSNDGKDES